MIPTRDTALVEKKLKEFPNLELISHDRGIQYVNVSNEYIHVLDRFHLLKNLFDMIKQDVNSNVKHKIRYTERTLIKEQKASIKTLPLHKQKKIKLIKEIRKDQTKGHSLRKIARKYNIDRKTVKKYAGLKNDSEIFSFIQNKRNRSSMYDKFKNEIITLYNKGYTSKYIYTKIKANDQNYKSDNLRYYIRNKIGDESRKKRTYNSSEYSVTRFKLFRDMVGLSISVNEREERALARFYKNNPKYLIIKKFYKVFKNAMTNLDSSIIKSIIKRKSNVKLINTYNKSLKNNYISVINSASYAENNGIVEGIIRRLKSIKSEMFGKCSFNLLKRKVIYRSLFF